MSLSENCQIFMGGASEKTRREGLCLFWGRSIQISTDVPNRTWETYTPPLNIMANRSRQIVVLTNPVEKTLYTVLCSFSYYVLFWCKPPWAKLQKPQRNNFKSFDKQALWLLAQKSHYYCDFMSVPASIQTRLLTQNVSVKSNTVS